MVKRALMIVALGAVAAAAPAYAHHSFAAAYFEDQHITIEGELVEFEYRTPHAWVHINVPDENGQMQRYSAEWFSATRLKSQGVTPETLKVGDHLILGGAPGRNAGERKLHLKSIERPADGWKMGSGGGPGGRGGRGPFRR
jgi:hypothetical protein